MVYFGGGLSLIHHSVWCIYFGGGPKDGPKDSFSDTWLYMVYFVGGPVESFPEVSPVLCILKGPLKINFAGPKAHLNFPTS